MQSQEKQKLIDTLTSRHLAADPADITNAIKLLDDSSLTGSGKSVEEVANAQAGAFVDGLRLAQRVRTQLFIAISTDGDVLTDALGKKTNAGISVSEKANALQTAKDLQQKQPSSANEEDVAKKEKELTSAKETLKAAETESSLQAADRGLAARIVATTLAELVRSNVNKRVETVQQYETAVSFVGEVAGAK
jgi:hypothetical protein